jgi:hypothetical protein
MVRVTPLNGRAEELCGRTVAMASYGCKKSFATVGSPFFPVNVSKGCPYLSELTSRTVDEPCDTLRSNVYIPSQGAKKIFP